MELKKARLLVSATSYGKNDPRLKTELEAQVAEVIYNPTGKPLASAELAKLLPGIDGFIAGLDEINAAALVAADRLKVIARYGVGIDNVDIATAHHKGIVVTNTPGANATSVAELALTLILALARQLIDSASQVRQGKWPRPSGVTLEGKTVGILGLGAIGKKLARRLQGFDCRILAYDPFVKPEQLGDLKVELANLDTVRTQADFLSLHLPLLPETRLLVTREFLSAMKKGSFLVNTSRGDIVDEAALVDSIQSGHLRGAGLDVLTVEPPDPANPLLALPQVIISPHLGSQTDGATSNMGWMAMKDCLAVLRGEEPAFPVR